ncbi:hypothetical protein BWI17_10470 [Betaproteobacteria bacterium GR16-43]|nr:hypothetical protein BWI17_10470 [Betaproteobacteria bacterium GR16-43]
MASKMEFPQPEFENVSTAAPNPSKRSRRLRTVFLAGAAVVGLYAVVGFFVVPPLVKKTVIDQAREKVGRAAVIDDLSFNPFTLFATARGFRLMEVDGTTPFVSFDQLDLDGSITSVYRIAPVFDKVTLAGLKVNLVREADTRYNASDILAKLAALPPRPETGRFQFSLGNIRLTGARVDFEDRPKGGKHEVSEIDIAIPSISNLPAHLKEYVQPSFAAKVNGAPFHLQGETLPFENSLRTHLAIDLDGLDIQRYAEYSPSPLPVKIDSGKLDAKLSIRFTQSADKDPTLDVAGTVALRDLKVTAPDDGGSVQVARIDADIASLDPILGLVKVNSLKVTDAGTARGPMRFASTEARDIRVDLKKKRVDVASLGGNGAVIEVKRSRDGSIEMPVKIRDDGPASEPASSPWVVTLDKLALDGYRVTLHDAFVKPAAAHRVHVVHLEAASLSTEKGAKSTLGAKLALDKSGSVDLEGAFSVSPLEVKAKVDARHLDIVLARRYVDPFKTVAVKSGFASAKGTFTLHGEGNAMKAEYNGTAGISNLATVDTTIDEDLLNWDAVRVSGIAFKWTKDAPLDLAIAEVAVDRIYSRVVVNPDGKLNLQQLKGATPAEPDAAAPAPGDVKPRNVRIDRVVFTGSRLNFTDHFIKPNYTADVGSLEGTVTNLSSDPSARGVVDLKGAYDQTSPVTIAGTVNPLSDNLFLDIAAKGKDIELPKLSAYSMRYAGYGITQGKLTLDVKYHIEDGKMQGRNNIFIDQLTFGEHVDNPDATKLPVLFAVNLLKDSKGAINLELPISGSLDDPQFAIGALVGQVVANLLRKAITSPFSLLSGGGGGGDGAKGGSDDLAYVEFEPGRDQIGAANEKKLDAVAKALLDRPAIKLEMASHSDPQKDLAALKKASLRLQLKAADDAQYAALVKTEYLRAKAAEQPVSKEPSKAASPAEMEAFLLERVKVGDVELRALAVRRSEQVRTYLVGKGQLPAERVLIATADAPDKPGAGRVDFTLK